MEDIMGFVNLSVFLQNKERRETLSKLSVRINIFILKCVLGFVDMGLNHGNNLRKLLVTSVLIPLKGLVKLQLRSIEIVYKT